MENTKQKTIMTVVMALFSVITLVWLGFHTPFWDEAHAYTIARNFNIIELFQIAKYEGHLFIWYLVQMPFAKLNFGYPYSIYILNWLFCFLFLIVLWKKAPFSPLEKTLITFSSPIFCYFAIVARCYSIGILFVFLALSFWKERKEHPYLISFLLILSANTSAMCAIISLLLSFIFIIDILKTKDVKKILCSLLILFLGAFVVLLQIKGGKHPAAFDFQGTFFPKIVEFFALKDTFQYGFVHAVNRIGALLILIFYLISFYYIKNSKAALFFQIGSLVMLYFFFSYIYIGNWWHYLFYFIFFLVTVWIKRLYAPDQGAVAKVFNVSFLSVLLFFVFKTLIYPVDFYPAAYKNNFKAEAKAIKALEYDRRDKYKVYFIDLLPRTSISVIPYLPKLRIYNILGNDKYTIEGFKDNFHFIYDLEGEIDKMIETFDPNKTNILFADDNPPRRITGKKYILNLTPVYQSARTGFKIYETKVDKKGQV